MATPNDRKYDNEHEWAMIDGDRVIIGISDHAQDSLGDIVFIQLPDVGATVSAGDVFGEIESVKAVSDLYAPISGTVVKVNEALSDQPDLINNDPYGEGWMLEIEPSDLDELDNLMDADAYDEYVENEEA